MSLSNTMLITIREIEDMIDHTKPLKEKLLEAMEKVQNHWCTTNEDEQFRCAIGAILSKASDEDRELINDELEGMQGVYGLPTGMPVDLEFMLSSIVKCKIGLQKIWQEAKKPAEPKGEFIQ